MLMQPMCPIRDERCVGALCAWSVRLVDGRVACSVALRASRAGVPVVDERDEARKRDCVDRT